MCVYVSASEGGAIFKGCWEGNWSVFLGLHLQKGLGCSDPGLNNLSPIYMEPRTGEMARAGGISLSLSASLFLVL